MSQSKKRSKAYTINLKPHGIKLYIIYIKISTKTKVVLINYKIPIVF